jgi:Flp pilus assembly protein TadD
VLQWCSSHESISFLMLSTVWVFALYWRALSAPFVYDDLDQIVNNPGLTTWHAAVARFLYAPVAFTSDFRGIGAGSTYRPVYWITLALDHAFWGVNPAGFHLTNLLLHVANGFLGFVLLRRLRVSLAVSSAASLLWLSLPINSEVVTWISARAYSLSGVFILLSLLTGLWYLRRGQILALICYFGFSLFALLSHEQGVLILPLTLLIAFADGSSERPARRLWAALVGVEIAAGAVYFALKHAVGAHAATGAAAIKSFGLVFWQYVLLIIFPIHMSVERSTSMPADVFSVAAVTAWIGLIGLAGTIFFLRKKAPTATFGLAWLLVSLLPFCGFVFIYQGMAERFVYIASAGVALCIVSVALEHRQWSREIAIGAVVLWMVWGVWRLQSRVLDWCEPVALYRSSLQANPKSASLYVNLGFASREKGDLATAERSYLNAIRLQPQYQRAYASLGDVYERLGRTSEAEKAYQEAIALKPDDVGTILNLAVAFQQAGAAESAEREFRRAIALAPKDSAAYTDLGVLLYQQGRADEAARMFAQAIDNKSTDPTPYYDLAALLQQAGRGDLALVLYKKVLEIKPGDPDTIANIQRLENAH